MNIGLPFDPSAMVRFRKRLTLERLEAINEQIIRKMEAKRKAEEDHQDDDKPQPPSNKGTLIVFCILWKMVRKLECIAKMQENNI